jgi:phytoene dehydrogenase-like protein
VREVLVDKGRACGVRLETGETLSARHVVAACDPYKALNSLLPSGALSEGHAARARAIPTTNDHCGHLKVDVALSGRLDLKRLEAARPDATDLRLPGLTFGTLEQLCEAIRDAQAGRLAKVLPFTGMIPTAADQSQAPDGQDTLYLWAGWVPPQPDGGWPALRQTAGERLLEAARTVIDGIDALTIGTQIETPEDLEERTGLTSGNPYQVDLSPLRLGPLRPALGFGGYRTPLRGFFITGGGTHPGPSVSGIPGRLAAEEVLRLAKPRFSWRHD